MIKKAIIDSGAFACGEVPINEINFYDDIRAICEGNGCRVYGKTWVCPPAIGTVEDLQMFGKSLDSAVKDDNVGIVFTKTEGVRPQSGDTVIRYQDYHVIDTSDIVN